MRKVSWICVVGFLILTVMACGEVETVSGCIPGTTRECACEGRQGQEICQPDSMFGPCDACFVDLGAGDIGFDVQTDFGTADTAVQDTAAVTDSGQDTSIADDTRVADDTSVADIGSEDSGADVQDDTDPGDTSIADTGQVDLGDDVAAQDVVDEADALPPLECVAGVLPAHLGDALVTVDTRFESNDFASTCGGDDANDAAYEWRVPFSGWWLLDTAGSDYNTVLHALPDCESESTYCNETGQVDATSSEVVAYFEKDERWVVVLDGSLGDDGEAVLNIAPVDCPESELSSPPATFTLVQSGSDLTASCGDTAGTERTFLWTAETEGLYRFYAESGDFSPTLSFHDGPRCGSPEHACSDADSKGLAEIFRFVEAGDIVTLVMDSAEGESGDVSLDAEWISEACPTINLLDQEDYDMATDSPGNRWSASCAVPYDAFYDAELNDILITYQPPAPPVSCSVYFTFPAEAEVTVALIQGTCAGPEVGCFEPDASGNLFIGIPDGRFPYTFVVSPKFDPSADVTFTASVGCIV